MASRRKIEANRRNSRKSCGPRSAAGKATASRNSGRHGLAALTCQPPAPSGEIERLARVICGNDDDPEVFALAAQIAQNEAILEAISAQRIAVIDRLRDPYVVPFSERDNSLDLAQGRLMTAWLADREIQARLPQVMQKYQHLLPPPLELDKNRPDWIRDYDEIVPIRLKALLEESDPPSQELLEFAMKRIEERDDGEALEAAAPDLIRLDRYERRTWARQKRTIRDFVNLKLMRALRQAAEPSGSIVWSGN
jgi:hypothetical protein